MSAIEPPLLQTSLPESAPPIDRYLAGLQGAILGGILGALFLFLSEWLHHRLNFAELAIIAAGDNPPVEVAQHLESLRRWQGAGNVALLFATMGGSAALVLAGASAWFRWNFRRLLPGALLATLIGSCCGSIAGIGGWLLYRLRPMGDQDLVIASVIQAVVWGLLGLGVGLSIHGFSHARLNRALTTGMFPALWGLTGSALLTILFPIAYVGTVVPQETSSRRIWAAAGGALLAIGAVKSGVLRPSAPGLQPETES